MSNLALSQGSVNHIEWSPFNPDVFLSCSSDETVQMWKQGRPVMTFKSIHQGPVFFAKWSPNCSTMFGVVKEDQVEIWDLNLSMWVHRIEISVCFEVFVLYLLFSPDLKCDLIWRDLRSLKAETFLCSVFPTIVHHAEPGVRLTSLLFARGTDCVLVGDSGGQVTVYKLKNFRVGESKQVKLFYMKWIRTTV